MENWKIEIDGDGIALITFDVPGRSMNTMTLKAVQELGDIAKRIKTEDAIKGAVFQSGKATGFCAGADLDELEAGADAAKTEEERLKLYFDVSYKTTRIYRELETCGKPVAVALEGLALGGGLELCLACHYRVVADNPKIKLGLPEAKVGLLPGAGGTQRLPRLIGVQNAAMLILQGGDKSPQEAKALGYVNEVVPAGETVEAAKTWVKANPKAVAPWDVKGYRVKDGPHSPAGTMIAIGGNAMVSKQTNLNFPAQRHIMSCIYEGVQVPMDAALRIESRYFAKTAATPQAKGMMRSLFVSMQALAKGGNRPKDVPQYEIKKVAVIGAGLMGAGIAYVQAKAGIETVVGQFPLMANGRALTMEAGESGGFVRVTARKDNHVIVGIHAVGPHISELSGEFALALEMGSRLEDIADSIHVHPTLSESFAESTLAALGHAIHI